MQSTQSAQREAVAAIYPQGIIFNPDSDKDQIRVDYSGRNNGNFSMWSEDLPLQAAIDVFRMVGLAEPAGQLTAWVAKCHQDEPQKEGFTNIPGELQKKITFQLIGDKFLKYPLDQVGCEGKAAERGEAYTAPTSEQFLKTAAKSLAKFELPYKRERFLAKPDHLLAIYMKYAGSEVKPAERVSLTLKLQTYISEEAQRTDVSLREISRAELVGKVELPNYRGPAFLLELKIGNQVCYLDYQGGQDPFAFLKPLYTPAAAGVGVIRSDQIVSQEQYAPLESSQVITPSKSVTEDIDQA